MIVWLASYPRSGNTLLRTILKQCFNLGSHAELAPGSVGEADNMLPESIRRKSGFLGVPNDWDSFYRRAVNSPELELIKTHSPPPDEQAAIYVARMGQPACYSYYRFHQKYHFDAGKTLFDVILGNDIYGDWSSHYDACNRPGAGPRLFLRFEELVNCSRSTLDKIAAFIGYEGEIKSWQNPMPEFHTLNPDFFRQGSVSWEPPAEWNPVVDGLFWAFHHRVMAALDYPMAKLSLDDTVSRQVSEMGTALRRSILHAGSLQSIADERFEIIRELDAACRQRDTEIESLKKKGRSPRPGVVDRFRNKMARVISAMAS